MFLIQPGSLFLIPLIFCLSHLLILPYIFFLTLPSLTVGLSEKRISLPPSSISKFTNLSLLPLQLFFSIFVLWELIVGPESLTLFGHLYFSSFFWKFSHFLIFMGFYVFFLFTRSVFSFSKITIDIFFILEMLSLSTLILFSITSVLGFIFILEFITLLFFILVAPTSISNSLKSPSYGKLENEITAPFEGLFFFFWTSFIISFGLFYSTLLLSFSNILSISSMILLYSTSPSFPPLVFIFLLILLFLKCGLVPFFFWKPVFFNSLPLILLFTYITFFYLFLLIWIFLLLLSLSPLLIPFIAFPLFILLIISSPLIFSMMGNITQLKIFLAISSIFNTAFLWLAISII